ncbi:MAG: 2OG-Fe(II) oxygenase family protein [Actinomycetota bacterium]
MPETTPMMSAQHTPTTATATTTTTTTGTALEIARALNTPGRAAVLRRDRSVAAFWADHRQLLRDAWADWDSARHVELDDSVIIDPALRGAVASAWGDPTTESAVRNLVHEAAPGVFSFQFFDPDRIATLRTYLGDVWDAGVPLRPPYGIVLNRQGAMLDLRSDGSLAAPSFQRFYRLVIDSYMRPIARLLFPDIVGYDSQSFGFSIHYRPDTDTSIRPHTDASTVTLNINANLPGEEFTGSTVDFLDPATGDVTALSFEPGTAMIHRGNVPHTAQPITSGERTNLVLWLNGSSGSVPPQQLVDQPASAHERWTQSHEAQDSWAPF